jgi:hypothetical protein
LEEVGACEEVVHDGGGDRLWACVDAVLWCCRDDAGRIVGARNIGRWEGGRCQVGRTLDIVRRERFVVVRLRSGTVEA